MLKTIIPFEKIPQLAKTDVFYARGDEQLKPFYRYTPALASFDEALRDRAGSQPPRADLVEVLQDQYSNLPRIPAVLDHIEALRRENVFTVTTAHQPSLFLGPLYFLYKALTTIILAESISSGLKDGRQVVPVFVLGSEDHDLDELNTIHLYNKKLSWETEQKGPVGSMDTSGLTSVLAEIKTILGESDAAKALFQRVERAYTENATIAGATQAMLHDLFGAHGLVVLNMNDTRLKRHFIPVMRAELLEQPCFRIVNETIAQLNDLGFKTQAAPREINLFYMTPGMRERIVLEDGAYKVLNTSLVFSKDELLGELESHPERFSPNVVLRPLFQEMILPNLAYVGGGGELAYWLERKSLFEHFGIPFPMLARRHSVLWLDRDMVKKLQKFGFDAATFFADTDSLIRTYVEQHASGEVSLSLEISDLQKIFDNLARKATAVDPTLEKAVRAEEVKTVGLLEQWQNRLIRAEKQKHEVTLNQIRALKEKLFPGNGLQERYDNFLPYLLKYGDAFIGELKTHLKPFDAGFVVLEDRD